MDEKSTFHQSIHSVFKSPIGLLAITSVMAITAALMWASKPLPFNEIEKLHEPTVKKTYLAGKRAEFSEIRLNSTTVGVALQEHFALSSEAGSIIANLADNTAITTYNGDAIDVGAFELSSRPLPTAFQTGEAFEFGIAKQHLIFSKPVELSINVDYPDGTPVSIYAKHAGQKLGQSGLTQDFSASCSNGISSNESNQAIVQNGKVSFATCGASLFVVRDNVDNVEIDTVRGMCLDDKSFEYQVHWHDDTGSVSQVQIVNDSNGVLATGSSSPITISKANSSNTTAFNIRVRDKNNTSDISSTYQVRPENCSQFGLRTFTSNSQFTVPDNVYQINVLAIGGGGGGQAVIDKNIEVTNAGGGGGGGAAASSLISVIPGQVLDIKVGSAGENQVNKTKKNGGNSSVKIVGTSDFLVLAAGGKTSGSSDRRSESRGADGGQANDSIGQIRFSGGDGANGQSSDNSQLRSGGGGGAAGYAGNGGDGVNGGDTGGAAGAGNGNVFPSLAGNGVRGRISNNTSEMKDGLDGEA